MSHADIELQPSDHSTPSLRRGQIIQVHRTAAHEAIIANTEFSLFYEITIAIYLAICELAGPESPPQVPTCNMNSKHNTLKFLVYVLLPVVAFRSIGYLILRNRGYSHLRTLALLLSALWNISFGIWTYFNIWHLIKMQAASPIRCMITAQLDELNYEIILIFGSVPALTIFAIAVLILLCGPCVIHSLWSDYTERRRQTLVTQQVIESLLRFKWQKKVFTNQTQCVICMTDFTDVDEVTPLPCDFRHYFHTKCIEDWLPYHNACPLCKTSISVDDIARTSAHYHSQIQRQQSPAINFDASSRASPLQKVDSNYHAV